jgi:hypothetical protein
MGSSIFFLKRCPLSYNRLPAVGVQSLLVNGELVVDGGELVLDAAPGRPIRRTAPAR